MKILKIGATWCASCNQLSKTISGMDLKIPVEEIDVDEKPEVQAQYSVRGIPVLIKVDSSGKEISRVSGNISKESILKFI
jgi:thioredoxin-like negative regulator of GroEL